jgi:hypothetical protein
MIHASTPDSTSQWINSYTKEHVIKIDEYSEKQSLMIHFYLFILQVDIIDHRSNRTVTLGMKLHRRENQNT